MKTNHFHLDATAVLAAGMLGISACMVAMAPGLESNAQDQPAQSQPAENQSISLPTIQEVMACLRFDAEAQQKLLGGEIISGQIDETTDRELAVSVAMLDRRPLADVVKFIHDLRDLERTEFHVLGDVQDIAGFAKAGFKSNESDDAADLLKSKPGSDFNLSSDEYRQFSVLAKRLGKKAAKTPPGLDAINDQLRQILRDRYAAYRAQGLNGIARYDRGGGKSSGPQDDLFAATSSSGKFVSRCFPPLQQSLIDYPSHQFRDLEHQFFWSKQDVEDRPTFMLSHRVYFQDANFALIVERQFYVGHSYNAMQIVVGCLPHGDGTLVFYTNRTATDQVAGFGSGLAHKIGRNQMRKEIIASFERLRKSGSKSSR